MTDFTGDRCRDAMHCVSTSPCHRFTANAVNYIENNVARWEYDRFYG